MSNIPSTAISAALTPVQRATHELLRAKQVQRLKNQHHAEDVEELDDTAVNSVHDQGDREKQEKNPESTEGEEEGTEEHVEIATLGDVKIHKAEAEGVSHLDISA